MALVKFNRTATKATAIGASKDADTLYFPTDEQSIYLGGKRVGGDSVSTAGKVGNSLTLQLNGGSAKTFNGSAAVTFDVTPSGIGAAPTSHNHDSVYSKLNHTHTASEVGAAPTNHTHDIKNITSAGAAAQKGVVTSLDNSANLPTSSAVMAYVNKQIKNYTSAFRYAGKLNWASNDWYINDIPTDIVTITSQKMSLSEFVGNAADEGYMKVGFSFYVGTVSSNPVDNTFSGEIVQYGDMVTCVNLYNAEEDKYEPQYNVVNSNITVTETVDNSTKVPTAGAVQSAISTAVSGAVSGLDGTAVADTNYVLTGVTEANGIISRKSQVAVDQTYSSTSSNPASGKSIAAAIAAIGTTKSASSGYAITGITQENGVIKSITQAAFNNYTHPSYTATTGVPTANVAPGFGETFQVNQIASNTQGHVTSSTARTITIPNTKASNSTDGLMSKELYIKLNDVYNALTWV